MLQRPRDAQCLLVLAHGAGAGMRHVFMQAIADALAREKVATLRYQFPYMEQGKRRPDFAPILCATVRAALHAARTRTRGLPIFAGGKSMGGRMTTQLAAKEALGEVQGLVFFGFPLHPARKPATTRAEHLADVSLPMLFLQGDRDALADLSLLRGVLAPLSDVTLHVVEGADHGFHVLKRSGRTDDEVLDELARTAAAWCGQQLGTVFGS